MNTFAANLKKRAEQLGISNAEVARRVGLTERRYGNYTAGTREPDLATLVKISSVLATSLDHLVGLGSEQLPSNSKRAIKERIASAAEALDEDDLSRLAIMMDALVASRHESGRNR